MNSKTRTLCEAAMLLAVAQVLSYINFSRMPDGGSITFAMVPVVLFGVRHGFKWGALAGFVYGLMQYFIGGGISIDWTTMICDYLIAYTLLGAGAGVFHRKQFGVFYGTLLGGGLQFLSSYLVGVFIWGQWMPEEFLGMTMTTPWIYSFIYNIIWAGPCIVLALLAFGVSYKALRKYYTGADLAAK